MQRTWLAITSQKDDYRYSGSLLLLQRGCANPNGTRPHLIRYGCRVSCRSITPTDQGQLLSLSAFTNQTSQHRRGTLPHATLLTQVAPPRGLWKETYRLRRRRNAVRSMTTQRLEIRNFTSEDWVELQEMIVQFDTGEIVLLRGEPV